MFLIVSPVLFPSVVTAIIKDDDDVAGDDDDQDKDQDEPPSPGLDTVDLTRPRITHINSPPLLIWPNKPQGFNLLCIVKHGRFG